MLIEGLIIVLSILLAFSIDALWQDHRQSQESEAVLESLRSDFERTGVELERVLANHGRGQSAAAELIRLIDQGVTASDALTVDSLTSEMSFAGATFDPPMGTVQALLASGEISLLDDPELRAELTAWPANSTDLIQEESATLGEMGKLFARLSELGIPTRHHVLGVNKAAVGLDVPWEVRRTNTWQRLDDVVLQNAISDIWFGLTSALTDGAKLEASYRRIVALLGPGA